MIEKQSKRILPQLFSCIQKQKDITVITLLTIRKYQSIAFCIVKLPFWNMVRMDGSRDPLVSIYVSWVRGNSYIIISIMISVIVSQALLSLPWFAKVGFLYPPPFPLGRQCSQNGRTILADGT